MNKGDVVSVAIPAEEFRRCLDIAGSQAKDRIPGRTEPKLRILANWTFDSETTVFNFFECADDELWNELVHEQKRKQQEREKTRSRQQRDEAFASAYMNLGELYQKQEITYDERSERLEELFNQYPEHRPTEQQLERFGRESEIILETLTKYESVWNDWERGRITEEEARSRITAICTEAPWLLSAPFAGNIYELCPDLRYTLDPTTPVLPDSNSSSHYYE